MQSDRNKPAASTTWLAGSFVTPARGHGFTVAAEPMRVRRPTCAVLSLTDERALQRPCHGSIAEAIAVILQECVRRSLWARLRKPGPGTAGLTRDAADAGDAGSDRRHAGARAVGLADSVSVPLGRLPAMRLREILGGGV